MYKRLEDILFFDESVQKYFYRGPSEANHEIETHKRWPFQMKSKWRWRHARFVAWRGENICSSSDVNVRRGEEAEAEKEADRSEFLVAQTHQCRNVTFSWYIVKVERAAGIFQRPREDSSIINVH